MLEKMNITEKEFFLNSNNHCEEIEKIRNKLKVNKKRTKKLLKDVNIIKQTKRGRKIKDDFSKVCHNKFSSDNIIKSIKTKINSSLILFINKIINSIYNIEEIRNSSIRTRFSFIILISISFNPLKDFKSFISFL